MKNLKETAKKLEKDISSNPEWIHREISFVIDGSHQSGARTYRHIINVLDTTKKGYGRGNNNLIAYVGNVAIQDIYNTTGQQANRIYKYLSASGKKWLNDTVKELLKSIEV